MTLGIIPISLVTVVALVGVVVAQPKHTPPKTDKEKIANAMSAAPKAVAQEATIVDIDEKGQMKVLREGRGPSPVCRTTPCLRGMIRCASTRPGWNGPRRGWVRHRRRPESASGTC